MSIVPKGPHGFYDKNGRWKRSKMCLVPCKICTCGPPMGQYQLKGEELKAHRKRLANRLRYRRKYLRDQKK